MAAMTKAILLALLKVLMIVIFAGWIALWILKPTNLWTRKWKGAEESARHTVFGYYGLNFAVFAFPLIALTITGVVYLNLVTKEPPRSRPARSATVGFSNPVVVNSFVGILSSMEILAVFLFLLFLAWTYYARISNDFKKLMPIKSLKLDLWQIKYLRVATRFGLLAEVCLALLLLPILRVLPIFQLIGIQFEASVRYHILLGTSMIFFATIHGASTLFIWGVSHHIQDEAELDSDTGSMNCVPVSTEGPYGPASLDFLRHDSLLLIAGGAGITPFLSIIKEIASVSSSRYRLATRVQLIYVVKKSQDVCLLNSVSSQLLNHSSTQFSLNLKVYVTQEESSNATVIGLLNDFSLVRTVNLSTKCSNYAVHGLDNSILMAAMVALSSIKLLVSLIFFNRIFVPTEMKSSASQKMVVPSENKASKEKTPSSVVDLLLLASFIIALVCNTFVAIILRWKRLKKDIPAASPKQGNKAIELIGSVEASTVEEHEIHFGGRPNFQDILSKFPDEIGGSDIGVLVCGPESMKESVASLCQLKSQGLNIGAKGKKPYFIFHSLNFTL
ncbi:hypothetical protein SADUNF_Sadunf12G0064700 [Salix dunnii]|uniref:FAD-binding FR-type domain-containing protein n=1 Tax=Salix dunnii TaxID=1413687 RepID=A0A835MW07_9ROSI|nr:hypothetical protein SADUNF_Sadunf12G0064700 [Salix dunnii]